MEFLPGWPPSATGYEHDSTSNAGTLLQRMMTKCCRSARTVSTGTEISAKHFQKFCDLLKVLTEDLFFARVAENVCRMKRCQSLGALKVVEPSADFGDALSDSEQGPDSGRTEAADEPGPDNPDLSQQKRRAHLDFVRQRCAIARRTAFYDVADINFLALHANKLNHPIQQLAGASDKGQPLRVFIGARSLADKNKLRVWVSLPENNGVAASRQPAPMTITEVFSNHFERFIFPGRARRRGGVEKIQELGRRSRRNGRLQHRGVIQWWSWQSLVKDRVRQWRLAFSDWLHLRCRRSSIASRRFLGDCSGLRRAGLPDIELCKP